MRGRRLLALVATERLRASTTARGRRLLLVLVISAPQYAAGKLLWYSPLRDTEPEVLQSLTLSAEGAGVQARNGERSH
jgi:hypothetical protein